MQLSQCPYDGTEIGAETVSGGSWLLWCECCGARWELHGAWLRRVSEPDRDAVRSERSRQPTPAPNN